jgi:tetratricopeptide (TPR) repeat protein
MACSPSTAGKESFYFGYIAHNYHSKFQSRHTSITFVVYCLIHSHSYTPLCLFVAVAVYGAILGGMEKKALQIANELNEIVNEEMFNEFPDLVSYLESYSALEVHAMIRFGLWKELLEIESPKNSNLMLFRAASIKFARALAYAVLGNVAEARKEADHFDRLRGNPDAKMRILHNNSLADLFAVDSVMARGEISYREGKYAVAFGLLRKAVVMQDTLNYDEPWGKMQPIRHALGGLLLEQGVVGEATKVFRKDLKYHPRNPWALVGLIRCLKRSGGSCCSSSSGTDTATEIAELEEQLRVQRQSEWADFDVTVSCACCIGTESNDEDEFSS